MHDTAISLGKRPSSSILTAKLNLSGNAFNSSVPDDIAMLPELGKSSRYGIICHSYQRVETHKPMILAEYLAIEESFLEGNLSFVEKMPKIGKSGVAVYLFLGPFQPPDTLSL